MAEFTWLPFFEEMLSVVCEKYDKTSLCKIFHQIFTGGGTQDRDTNGKSFPLQEIDPLTFIGFFNRVNTDVKRINFCSAAKSIFKLQSPVPQEFSGIPRLDARNTWFFGYAANRGAEDIDNLWSFAVALNQSKVNNEVFSKALNVKMVGLPKLTCLMFICKPKSYIGFDKVAIDYFEKSGFMLNLNLRSEVIRSPAPFDRFMTLISGIKDHFGKEFYEISHDAYLAATKGQATTVKLTKVKTKEQVYENVKCFNRDLKSNLDLAEELARITTFWVYDSTSDSFGPAKFVGFADTTYEKYRLCRSGKYTGTHFSGGESKEAIQEAFKKPFAKSKTGMQLLRNWFIKSFGKNTFDLTEDKWKFLDFSDQIETTTKNEANMNSDLQVNNQHQLNTILYGPPGTGKTYKVYEKAVQIIKPDFIGDRAALIKEFTKLQNDHNIEFVTFHQSYSYEEFVEGIRPTVEGGLMRYEVKDGILKSIAKMAATEFLNAPVNSDIDLGDIDIFKMSLGDTGKSEEDSFYDYCIDNNCVGFGWGGTVDFSPARKTAKKNLKSHIEKLIAENAHIKESNFTVEAVFRFLQMNVGDIVLISKGNHIIRAAGQIVSDYEYISDADIRYCHYRKVKWLLKDVEIPISKISQKVLSQQTIYKLNKENLNFENLSKLLRVGNESQQIKNYVLIIDEINRGNISKIFGEAITLLDLDKRMGAENQTILTLPYSQEVFGLTRNLYILGTMNTADRSIALMDIALRRRFDFEEIMPDANVISSVLNKKHVDDDLITLITNVFNILNRRIEVLLDREHQIGHSYFLDVNNETELYNVWYGKIIPLLQEYFYNDWDRLRQLLGAANGDGLIRNTTDIAGYKGLFNGDEVEYPCQIHRCASSTELRERLIKAFNING